MPIIHSFQGSGNLNLHEMEKHH